MTLASTYVLHHLSATWSQLQIIGVKIEECELEFFFIFFLILFSFQFIFHFSIFRTLGLGLEVIGHTVTLVTSDGVVTTLIIGLKRKK